MGVRSRFLGFVLLLWDRAYFYYTCHFIFLLEKSRSKKQVTLGAVRWCFLAKTASDETSRKLCLAKISVVLVIESSIVTAEQITDHGFHYRALGICLGILGPNLVPRLLTRLENLLWEASVESRR